MFEGKLGAFKVRIRTIVNMADHQPWSESTMNSMVFSEELFKISQAFRVSVWVPLQRPEVVIDFTFLETVGFRDKIIIRMIGSCNSVNNCNNIMSDPVPHRIYAAAVSKHRDEHGIGNGDIAWCDDNVLRYRSISGPWPSVMAISSLPPIHNRQTLAHRSGLSYQPRNNWSFLHRTGKKYRAHNKSELEFTFCNRSDTFENLFILDIEICYLTVGSFPGSGTAQAYQKRMDKLNHWILQANYPPGLNWPSTVTRDKAWIVSANFPSPSFIYFNVLTASWISQHKRRITQ